MKPTDKHSGLTAEDVRRLFHYDPSTGVFTHATDTNRKKVGDVAGKRIPAGYRRIKLNGRTYAEHRLAWLYVHGVWPKEEIDHINRVKDDNRIENLREANRTQNCINVAARGKSTGILGVYFGMHDGLPRYLAYITVRRKTIKLGVYKTLAEARTARWAAEIVVNSLDVPSHFNIKCLAKTYTKTIGPLPEFIAEDKARLTANS